MSATRSAAKKLPSNSKEAPLRVRGVLVKRDEPKIHNRYYLLEEPPRYHLLHRERRSLTFRVPHPWLYYGITDHTFGRYDTLTAVRALFCRPYRLTKKNRELYYSPFPNLSHCWAPCYGPEPYLTRNMPPTFDRVSQQLNLWWDAISNNDYLIDQWYTNKKAMKSLGMQNTEAYGLFETWSKMTIADLRGIPWQPIINLQDPWKELLQSPLVNRAFTSDRSLAQKRTS